MSQSVKRVEPGVLPGIRQPPVGRRRIPAAGWMDPWTRNGNSPRRPWRRVHHRRANRQINSIILLFVVNSFL